MGVAPHAVIPVNDAALGVQRRRRLGDHGGGERLARVLLLAHPLHADRAARHGAGDQRRIRRDVIGAVVAVAAGPLDMDAAHLLRRQAQQLGKRVALGINALRMGPDCHAAAVGLGERAGRADGAVHPIGLGVAGPQPPDRHFGCASPVQHLDVAARQAADRRGDVVLVGQGGCFVPLGRGGQRTPRLHGLPFAFRDHGEVAALPHDGHHARHVLDRSGVERAEHCPGAGLAHGAGVQHPRQAHVLDVGGPARDLGRNVHTRQRRADHPVGRRVLETPVRPGRHVQRQAGGEVAIRRRVPVRRMDRAVRGLQALRRQAELAGGGAHQQLAHLGGSVHDRRPAVLHGVAAGGKTLVRRAAGVRGDQAQAVRCNVELLGGDLEQRRFQALAQFRLAGEHLDAAVPGDPDPGIKFRGFLQATRQWRRGGRGG